MTLLFVFTQKRLTLKAKQVGRHCGQTTQPYFLIVYYYYFLFCMYTLKKHRPHKVILLLLLFFFFVQFSTVVIRIKCSHPHCYYTNAWLHCLKAVPTLIA